MAAFNAHMLFVVILALFGVFASAHPKFSKEEMAEYRDLVARNTEALAHCLQTPQLKELNARMLDEHASTAANIRKARGLDSSSGKVDRRDKGALKMWIGRPHEHDKQSPDPQDIWRFRWSDPVGPNPAGCALSPESIYGPFWKKGQPERQDIVGGQPGVYMRLALQLIDVATCYPVPDARVDIWHANAVGEYGPEASSFLRGWQPSSPRGTVDFNSIFPGHYPGRSTHVHVLVTPKKEGKVVHVGMIYFPDDLREAIEATPEYAKNPNKALKNIDDDFAPYSASYQYDPFVQWSWLGAHPSDGVLSWVAMGVNLTTQVEQPHGKRSLFDDHLAHH